MPSTCTTVTLTPSLPFSFAGTAYSHGWAVLAPNAWDSERQRLERIYRLPTGRVVLLHISKSGSPSRPSVSVVIDHASALSSDEEQDVCDAVAHMLRLDEDFSAFYARCKQRGGAWAPLTRGLGRLLRSPTVFEDVVKTLCTTNIQWGGTKRMVRELVDAFGEPHPSAPAHRAFPTPEAITTVPGDVFAARVNLGYRAPYVYELAQRISEGTLNVEAWLDTDRPTPDLKEELLSLKGIGPYAAATLLMLLGRYDELPVDSVFRQFVGDTYFEGTYPSDAAAKALYEDWGSWKYLAYWFDMAQPPTDGVL